MPELPKRLILGNGEQYVRPQQKKSHGRASPMPRSYAQARDRVLDDVQRALQDVRELPTEKRFPDEVVLCLRLHPDMTAKSYDPHGIFTAVPHLDNVGSRSYRIATQRVAQTKRIKRLLEARIEDVTGRMVFVRSTDEGFRKFIEALDRSPRRLSDEFKTDIQRIENFNTLTAEEQLLGFPEDWDGGRVEIVLHPSRVAEESQSHFLGSLFQDENLMRSLNIAHYSDGPTFISTQLTRAILERLAGANPLRNVHPFVFGGFDNLRSAPSFPAPKPPLGETQSTIKIGMFDGGVDPNHPLLQRYVEQDDALSIKTVADEISIAHGTAVAGVILYGALNEKETNSPLPTPPVTVASFRVLPTSNPADIDLYECIDVIERVVPARKDLSIYNLSLGPRGPILDDSISRFTYALDALAAGHKVTFVVAVGNDGEAGDKLNRIQVPSDLVNGLGIGAYTIRNGEPVRALYSCIGPGRECGKLKPDGVAFGGCDLMPFHLVSSIPGQKVLSYGTSFAAPLVSSVAGQIEAAFDRSNALLARTLLIHTAAHPTGDPDLELGHGIIQQRIEDVLGCGDTEVTILFQGELVPKKMMQLPIMVPAEVISAGTVNIRWTIASLPSVSARHPADYTSSCIEDTFYPHCDVYVYSKTDDRGKKFTKRLNVEENVDEVSALFADGWTRSDLPSPESDNEYPTEEENRSLKYKWEPVVRRSVSKQCDSLNDPFLVLHPIGRNGATERFDYAAAITISAPGFSGDLYTQVLRQFSALQPIRLRTESELRISIGA